MAVPLSPELLAAPTTSLLETMPDAPDELDETVEPPAAASSPVPTARRGLFAASHLALQSLLLNALSVPVMAYIVRRLGDVGFGHWATAAALVASASVLANLGLRGAFVRSVARSPESAPAILGEQIQLRLLLALGAGVVAIVIACLLPYPLVVRACVAVAAGGLLLTTLNNTLADLLQALHRISVYAGTNFLAGLTLTVISLLAVIAGAGPVGLSIAYLAGPLVGAGLLARYVTRRLWPPLPRGEGWGEGDLEFQAGRPFRNHPHPSPLPKGEGTGRRFARLLFDSRFFAAQQLVNTLSLNIESLMLPLLVGAGEFGYFSAGLLLASRLVVIPDGLGSAFYPMVAARHAADPHTAGRELGKYLLLALAVCVPVAAIGMVLAGPIARLLFPHHAAVCGAVIRITIWSLPLLGVENLMGYSLNAAAQDAAQARQNLIWAVLNLAVAVPLVLKFGVIGACVSFVLRTVLKIICITPLFLRTFFRAPHPPMSQAVYS